MSSHFPHSNDPEFQRIITGGVSTKISIYQKKDHPTLHAVEAIISLGCIGYKPPSPPGSKEDLA